MRLEKISQDNVWNVAKLKVSKDQERFVASNVESILEAFAVREEGYVALPFALYEEDTLVGFCMLGYGGIGDDEEPEIVYGNYSIWRLMIGSSFQGKGLGKKAMEEILKYVKSFPFGRAEYCWVSYDEENVGAKKLYESFGFYENGDVDDGEIVAVLKL